MKERNVEFAKTLLPKLAINDGMKCTMHLKNT